MRSSAGQKMEHKNTSSELEWGMETFCVALDKGLRKILIWFMELVKRKFILMSMKQQYISDIKEENDSKTRKFTYITLH